MARTMKEEIMEGLPLTEREFEVLDGAARGETAKETAARTYLSKETVMSYRKTVVAKLAARNLAHAVALAIGHGYVNIEDVLSEHEGRPPPPPPPRVDKPPATEGRGI